MSPLSPWAYTLDTVPTTFAVPPVAGSNDEMRPGRSVNSACVASTKAMSHGRLIATTPEPVSVCVTNAVFVLSVGEFAGACVRSGGGGGSVGGGGGGDPQAATRSVSTTIASRRVLIAPVSTESVPDLEHGPKSLCLRYSGGASDVGSTSSAGASSVVS